jgi:predicted Zn-dependent peptidase
MKNLIFYAFVLMLLFLSSCKQSGKGTDYATQTATDSKGYTYEIVSNDPTGLRLYTLDNGLKVYLSQNRDEPKIQTYVAVRTGSNYDPKESTGLAHYLEHMLFKGTSEFGTLDWDQEKIYLDSVYNLYEEHRAEKDPDKKEALYREIDRVSYEASQFAIANEYDKMIASIGTQGANAHTWFEETVYHGKIPSNELEKWSELEADRFDELVLRLFHTELEAVYEEFNRSQDSDGEKLFDKTLKALFPTHPYGQQTTIGTSEHLKNPSLKDINEYFNAYYAPNNMAVVLVGDFEFESTIELIDRTFGKLESKDVTHPELPVEQPLAGIIEQEVFGPTSESLYIAYRSEGVGSKDEKMLTLIDMILSNSHAGLFDLNLNQKQMVQRAYSSVYFMNDYGFQLLSGAPKGGQDLNEVKALIFEQIEKIKAGNFEEWMIDAVINDLKLSKLRRYENNTSLASDYYNAFIREQSWADELKFLDQLKEISKQELVDFANKFYTDKYIVTYKRQGEDTNVVKVKNPKITPVSVNRASQSPYASDFYAKPVEELKPVFIDYEEEIKKKILSNGLEMSYITNETNDLFSLNIIFDMGNDHMKKLGLAVGYLDYIGTDKLTAEEVRKEFYKLGISYGVSTGSERSYVSLSGLQENLPEGLELLESLWANAISDQESYDKFVNRIMKARVDRTTNKGQILSNGLMNYGKYGEYSRLRNIITSEELQSMDPKELVQMVKDLKTYQHRIFYYGSDPEATEKALNDHHKVKNQLAAYPEPVKYEEIDTGGHVYFADYDMVQTELILLAKADKFDASKLAKAQLFNTYFGYDMSSIVFQEIRESKSLAYVAYSAYSSASDKDNSDYSFAYIQTQSNKLPQAVDAMMELMNDMPEVAPLFEASKKSTLKKIAAQRITKSNIFWTYEALKKRGIDHDNRKEIYEEIEKMTLPDLRAFFENSVKGKDYTALVIGNKKDIDFTALSKLGEVKELEIDYLFNYSNSPVKQ